MSKRIVAIDLLRGFALLGILLMNIMSFAMPDIAYFNPTTYGGDEWWNRAIYGLTHVVADQKFMALFSMLFGASVMLLTNKLSEKGQRSAKLHYVRNFWLLIIGLIHSILIWSGDVLVVYAVSAFLLYFFRQLAPKLQFIFGIAIFFVPTLLNIGIQATVFELDTSSQEAVIAYWQPDEAAIGADLEVFRGSYREQLASRWAPESSFSNDGQDLVDLSLLVDFFARALGMMLIGMAFYSWGVVTGKQSELFYKKLLLFGFGLGIPLSWYGLVLSTRAVWDWEYALFLGRIPNNLATPLIACGYIALIMLWSKKEVALGLRERLEAVGRMALTNYIGQSIIATFIFYGFGLALYGHIDRWLQLIVVVAIWAVQLYLSPWWLGKFRYGPLEWLWRTLTYWRPQPLRKAALS